MLEATSRPISRLSASHEPRLRAWAEALTASDALIVAISRKGPRLLQLLARDGLLPDDVLQRVVSERALPFITGPCAELIVVDDLVCWGSTFSRVMHSARHAADRLGCKTPPKGMPFAVSDSAHPKHMENVSLSFLQLTRSEVAPFVTNEVAALRLLGTPFDIEHPTATVVGNFDSPDRLDAAIEMLSDRLGGTLIPLESQVPVRDGVLPIRSWTILLGDANAPAEGQEIAKLRIYLTPEHDRLSIVVIAPVALTTSQLDSFSSAVPDPFGQLWTLASVCQPPKADRDLQAAAERSRAMWANYIHAAALLTRMRGPIAESFLDSQVAWSILPPAEDDIRLLVGPSLAPQCRDIIASAFEGSLNTDTRLPLHPIGWTSPSHLPERIPSRFLDRYTIERDRQLQLAQTTREAVEGIFYAQHQAIEIPSRSDGDDPGLRLEFGITFRTLINTVRTRFPDADLASVHAAFDRFIDCGAIVPRYLNFGFGSENVWVRAYRIGEGPLEKLIQTARLLFETLAARMRQDELPHTAFEKYCVLALSVAIDTRRLAPLRSLDDVRRRFHLYGARIAVQLGPRERFLADWAADHGLIESAPADMYRLNTLETTYPREDCPWDQEVRDGLEDIASLVAAIHAQPGLRTDALVLITTLATQADVHRAIEAELDLWLHDPRSSIFHALEVLAQVTDAIRDGGEHASTIPALRRQANDVIARTANFTGQIRKKLDLVARRPDILRQVGEAAAHDTNCARVWRDLHSTLQSRARVEEDALGLVEVTSACRIAHKMTHVLRDLLSESGLVDPQMRQRPLKEALGGLRELCETSPKVDEVTRALARGDNEHKDLVLAIATAESEVTGRFVDDFPLVRNVAAQIAALCERVLVRFGSDEVRESAETLSPPRFILMWDVRGSTEVESRRELEHRIGQVNRRIQATVGGRSLDFRPESLDDGAGIICTRFDDVIAVFTILEEVYTAFRFRAGVEVNLQGTLNYYPRSKALGGRAYEHAARVCGLFKEVAAQPQRWTGGSPLEEPVKNYLVVGEFARRFAEAESRWPPRGFEVVAPGGRYRPRVHGSLPIEISLLMRGAS